MSSKQQAVLSHRKLDQLRMLADWQLKEQGYDPIEITKLCQQMDDQREDQDTFDPEFESTARTF